MSKKHLFIFFTFFMVGSEAYRNPVSAQKMPANIVIRDFKVTYPSVGKVRLMMRAEGQGGVKVGSYMIRVGDVLPQRKRMVLSGLGVVKGTPYVMAKDFSKKEDALLKDNGQRDEDTRIGFFAITLNTSQWPEGRYYISMYAINRPAPDPYYVASRMIILDVGHPNLTGLGIEPNVPGAKNNIVWRKQGVYACFPSLVKLDDGRLVTTFGTRIRSSHIDTTGGTMTMVSNDGGYTWKATTEKFQSPELFAKDGRLVNVSAGGWVHGPASIKSRLMKEGWTTMDVKPGTVAWRSNIAYFNTSFDKGKTWKKKSIAIPNDVAGVINFSTLRTKSGIRLITLYGTRKNVPANQNASEVYFLRSGDDGKTWEFVYLTPGKMKQPSVGPNEATVIDLPNGELLAMLRTSDITNLYSSLSKDGGKTWSYPEDTGIKGYPPELTVLPDGRILCIYGYRRFPMGIRACISYNNGRTWDIKNELILRSDGLAVSTGDLGYPKITQLPNGELFTIYYIVTDGTMPYIAGTHFKIPPARASKR